MRLKSYFRGNIFFVHALKFFADKGLKLVYIVYGVVRSL